MAGLAIAEALGANDIEVKADFQVVVNKVWGEFTTKSEKLKKYLTIVGDKSSRFRYFQI